MIYVLSYLLAGVVVSIVFGLILEKHKRESVSMMLIATLDPISLLFWPITILWDVVASKEIEKVEIENSETSEKNRKIAEQRRNENDRMVGIEGITVTSMRPYGTIEIGGQRFQAKSDEGVLSPRIPIVVSRFDDLTMIVTKKVQQVAAGNVC